MIVRELVTKWSLKVDKHQLKALEDGISRAKKNFEYLVASTTALGGTLWGLSLFAGRFAQETEMAAKRLGMTTTALQQYGYAAELSGLSQEQLVIGLQRLQTNLAQAATEGTGPAAELFWKMGVSIRDATGHIKNLDTLIPQVVAGVGRLGNQAERMKAMGVMFGKGQFGMLSLFGNPDKLRALLQEFEDFKIGMTPEEIKRSAEFYGNMERVWEILKSLKNFAGSELAKVFGPIVDETLEWYRANKDLVRQKIKEFVMALKDLAFSLYQNLKRVAKTALELVDAIGGMTNAIRLAGIAFTAFLAITSVAALGGVVWGIAGIIVAMEKLGAVALMTNLKIMLIPLAIGLAIVALGLLIEDFFAGLEGKDSVFSRAWNLCADAINNVANAFNNFANAWNNIPPAARTAMMAMLGAAYGFALGNVPGAVAGGLIGAGIGLKTMPTIPTFEGHAGDPGGLSRDVTVNLNVQGLEPQHQRQVIGGALEDAVTAADLRNAGMALGGGGAW